MASAKENLKMEPQTGRGLDLNPGGSAFLSSASASSDLEQATDAPDDPGAVSLVRSPQRNPSVDDFVPGRLSMGFLFSRTQ